MKYIVAIVVLLMSGCTAEPPPVDSRVKEVCLHGVTYIITRQVAFDRDVNFMVIKLGPDSKVIQCTANVNR